jgi:hypothetical protein
MGGLGVISAGFLGAGAALALAPVVLHLLFRRKAPRVDLGSLRFLRIALKDNAHRRKVRRWLLLALRMAGVLLLGLLFARPYSAKPVVPGEEREVAILIDRSASMGAGGPNRSAYARAKEAASKLLAGLPAGTAIHLAAFDGSGVSAVLSGSIDDLPRSPGPSGTDFSKGIAWARDRVVQSRRKLREVYLYTDLQRTGLDHPPPDGFPTGIDFDVVDVGKNLRGNLAVDDARAVVEEIREGTPPLVSALVFNGGSFAVRGVAVRLSLEGPGGKFQLTETIDITGLGRREVRFRPDLKKPGLYRGTVEVVSNDELPFDNIRHLAFEARRPESVLLVDGEPGASVYSNDTYFLESALRLRLPGAGPSATPFDPRRIAWEGGANWPSLLDVRVVVLANVADVPKAVADSLKRFVEGGGRLVLFAGSKVEPGSLGSFRKIGLLPAEVDGLVDGPQRFESWDSTHPLLGPFADPQHGDLRALSFARLARLKPVEGSTVLASAKDGLPLLVEAKVGAGVVLQWASAANNDGGDWAIQRLYLPVMHQMMGYLTGRLPGSGLVRVAPLDPGTTPGIEVDGTKVVVRNGDPAESRIDRATLAEFRTALRLPESALKGSTGPAIADDAGSGSIRPGEFWRGVAWALLAILVVETFVANRTYA